MQNLVVLTAVDDPSPAAVADIDVIADAATAAAALDPLRARILRELVEPGSSSTVAAALGEPRQKINYHVRSLEEQGLVRAVGERRRRGLSERLVVAAASSFVIDPAALGANAPDPARVDRLSARYLLALASRMITEIADLGRRADAAGQQLATLSIDTEVRFASAADRANFTNELAGSITALVAKYHDEHAAGGRRHRLIVAAHPHPEPDRDHDHDPDQEGSRHDR